MDYLTQLYEWIGENDETFKGRYTFEDFTENMQDPAYVAQMHEWIGGIDDTFETRRPLDDFIELVKKKDDTQLSLSTSGEEPSESGLESGSSVLLKGGKTELEPDEETQYQEWLATNPAILEWKEWYTQTHGQEPDMESAEYDYRGAFKSGTTPTKNDQGEYFWDIKTDDDETWKKEYMDLTGIDPNVQNISKDDALLTIEQHNQTISDANNQDGEERDFFETSLDVINNDLIGTREENVVSKMNYHFKDYGFTFEEIGIGDAMRVTAANGETITIDLDPDISILGVSLIGRGKKKTKESDKLRNFLKDNREESEFITNTERGYIENKQKFRNEEDVKLKTQQFNEQSDLFRDEIEGFLKEREQFEIVRAEMLTWTQEEINANRDKWDAYQEESKRIENERLRLVQKEKLFQKRGYELDSLVGEYTEMQSQQGSWTGGIYNALLDGFGRISTGGMSTMVDVLVGIENYDNYIARNPDDFISAALDKGYITEGELQTIIEDNKVEYSMEGKKQWTTNQADVVNAIKSKLSESQLKDIKRRVKDLTKKQMKYDNIEYVDALDADGKPLKVNGRVIKLRQVKDERNPFSQAATAGAQQESMGMVDATRKGLRWVYGDDSTTQEWTDLKKEGFWGGAFLGLAESIPAMLGNSSWAGWAQRTAQMYAQVSDHLMEEMQDDPDFANISENEKMAVTLPIGAVVATLEAVGLRNIINKGGLINSIVLKSVAKSPKGKVGSQTFMETVQKEVKSRIARGMLVTGAAGAAEFETGFLQEGADIAGKQIYNAIKEKEMFETPSDFRSIMAQMLRGGAQEAIGGLVLGTPGGIVAGATNYDFTKVDDATWNMFEEINKSEKSHSDYFTFFVQDIKNKILNGKMTKKEGDAILNQFNKISGVYNQLPTDLNSDQKRKVLGLLLRKQELQEQTANKDKTLVKKQLAEIAEIDAKMESILQAEVATETETETTVTPEGKGVEVTTETDTQTDTQQDQLTQEQADIDTFFGEDVSDSQISVNENIVINNGKQGPQGQDLNTFTETLSDLQKTALNFAKTSLKAISTIAPNVKIVFHQNQNDYNAATGTKPGVLSRGSFDINTGLIHINLSKVKATTVPHEVFHAVIMNLTKTDAESSALTKKMMEAVRKGLTAGQQSLLNKIEAHASQGYDTDMIAEEELAELFGILASEYKNLNKPQKSAVLSWIKSMGQKMGFSMDFINQLTKDEEAVIDLMNTLATKVREGEVIQKSDVDVITGGRVRKKEATTKKEETTKKEKPKQKKEKETKKPKRKTKEQKAPKDLTFDEYVKRQTRNQKEETASEVFNLEELEVISKGGTGRIVYQHPTDKNKVIKVATSPRGLEQNLSVGFGDFNMLDGKIAELFEQGLDYIVVEKVPRNDKVVNKYLKGLKSAYRENGVDRFGNVAPIVQEIMQGKGLVDFLNYNLLWNDFLASRNWGVRADGEVVLVDEGALNDRVYYGSKIAKWAQEEWQEVKNRKRKDRETRKTKRETREQKIQSELTEEIKEDSRAIRQQKTLEETVDIKDLKKIGSGSNRVVYLDPKNNKVYKKALNVRGLMANTLLSTETVKDLGKKFPQILDKGLDYIVVEHVNDFRSKDLTNQDRLKIRNFIDEKLLKGFKFGVPQLKRAYTAYKAGDLNNPEVIQLKENFKEVGMSKFLDLPLNMHDFMQTYNWGMNNNGDVIPLDEGALVEGELAFQDAPKELQQKFKELWKDVSETRKIRNQITKDVKQWKMEETDMDAISQEAIKNFRPQGRKEGSLSSQLRQGEKQHFEIQRKIKEAVKRGKLKYSFDETPSELRVWIHSDGQPLGMVRATKVGGQRINYAGLEKALMGTGVGKTMYSLAQQYIMDNWVDKTLHSDYFMTHDAHNLWKSFVRRGLAESYVTKKGKTRYAMKPVTRKIRQQLDLFEDQEQEFSPSEFFESKIKEFKGDKYKAALATQEEVNRREQALQQPVKETKPTRTIEQVMTYFNMNPQGFIDKQNTVEYVQRFLPEGYKAHRAKMTYDGYGGGIYITKNGRRIKPTTPKRKTRLQKDMVVPNSGGRTILDYFVEGLENNFSRDMITDYLVRRKGLRVKDIKEFLKISKSDTKLLQSIKLLPKSFGNIKGGIKAGISLYNKVMNFRDNLIQKNKEGKLKRKLSEAEINQKTMEFLEAQPEYQQEADTYKKGKETKSRKGLSSQQALMQVELQKQFGKRPTREVGRKLRKLKFMLQNIGRGRRSLIQLKREVRNFMRMALPPGLYTKPEVLKLVRKLDQATEQNIDNILSEITDLAVKKNIQILNKELTNLLQGKYEQTVGGRKRGYKVDSRAKEILNKIKKAFQGTRNSTAVDIAADNTKLQARYDELAQQNTLTEAEVDEMSSLQIMIELNNSRLMGDNNVHKLTSLSTVVEQLADIVLGGKQRLNESIKAQHKEYRRQFSEAFYDMTGVKLPMQELEFAEQQYENSPTEENQAKLEEAQKLYDETINKNRREVNQKNNRQHVASRVKKLMGGILNSIGNVFHSHEALDGLMDKISMLPGKMFEGKMQTLVTERIDAASREFKGRKLAVEKMLQDKMKEIFGKKWKQIMVKNRNITNTGIFLNKKEVDKAQAEYDANPTKENLKKLNKIKADNELLLSQEQMYYYYNQYKDPANEGTFEAMYGPEYKRIMEEMTNQLTPETKAFADWQVDILFPSLYEHYNTTYQDIYRTNMPYNEHYAGKMYRDTEMKPLDLLGGNITGTSVGASSTLERTQNNNPLQKMNGTDVLLTYINDMEYFSAYAVPVRDINKIFDNPIIKNTIKDTHGNLTNTLINDAIKKIANKGVRTDLTNFAISHMNDVFILSRLGINPVVMLKQLTSFITYANDIGFVNYAKYGMKNIMQVKKTWKEIRDNSVYMQDRKNNGIMKAIESYSEKNMQEFVPTWFGSESIGAQKQFLIDFLMFTTKFGDRTAIMMGGMPNYLYYKAEFQKKNPKATEQQVIDYAIRKFERDTKRTQQSGDLQDKDIMQTGNPVVRALNMFMTTPKQYLRKEIQGFRNLGRKIAAMDAKAGKGTVWQNLRTIGMYHVVMPVFFQWVALGMPGMLRGVEDEDKEDLARAAILGNLNALFILGEAFNMAADFFTGKPYAGQNVKSVGILNIASRLTTMAKRADAAKDPAKQEELWMKFYLELSTLSGMPVPQVKRLWDNYSKLYSEDMPPGEAIMRLFNYSEWQIEGGRPDQKKSTKPIKLRKNELKEYHPDLYELKYGDMDGEFEEFEELENEMKEEQKLMRQEMLEELYD